GLALGADRPLDGEALGGRLGARAHERSRRGRRRAGRPRRRGGTGAGPRRRLPGRRRGGPGGRAPRFGRVDVVSTPASTVPELASASAGELARRIAAKELTSREVVEGLLERIEAVNPAVNAI